MNELHPECKGRYAEGITLFWLWVVVMLSLVRCSLLWNELLHHAFSGDLTARWREAHLKELLAEMEQQARVLAAAPGREQLSLP